EALGRVVTPRGAADDVAEHQAFAQRRHARRGEVRAVAGDVADLLQGLQAALEESSAAGDVVRLVDVAGGGRQVEAVQVDPVVAGAVFAVLDGEEGGVVQAGQRADLDLAGLARAALEVGEVDVLAHGVGRG